MSFESYDDPFNWFGAWFDDAKEVVKIEPNAMTLATVDSEGNPSARVVLLKSWDPRGFVFYTNYQSRKGQQILQGRKASMSFYWRPLARQIMIEGIIEEVDPDVADAYFDTRPRQSRIGAWASQQSEVLDSKETLLNRFDDYEKKFANGPIPRPPHWSGFCLKPLRIEFWQAVDFRIHDRIVFHRDYIHQTWTSIRLNP